MKDKTRTDILHVMRNIAQKIKGLKSVEEDHCLAKKYIIESIDRDFTEMLEAIEKDE